MLRPDGRGKATSVASPTSRRSGAPEPPCRRRRSLRRPGRRRPARRLSGPGALCASRFHGIGPRGRRCRLPRSRLDMVPGVRLPLQTRAEMLAVLARRGMVRPIRPDRLARAGLALHRWGPTPAGSFTVNAITRSRPARADRRRRVGHLRRGRARARTRSRAGCGGRAEGRRPARHPVPQPGRLRRDDGRRVQARRRLAVAQHLDARRRSWARCCDREQPTVLVHDARVHGRGHRRRTPVRSCA